MNEKLWDRLNEVPWKLGWELRSNDFTFWWVNHNGHVWILRIYLSAVLPGNPNEKARWQAQFILSSASGGHREQKMQHYDSIQDDYTWIRPALEWAENIILSPMELLSQALSEAPSHGETG